MTFNILKANAMPNDLKDNKEFKQNYELLDYFYEHINHTAGFVFRESELEKFIREYKADPVTIEEVTPQNWSETFASKFLSLDIISFRVDYKQKTNKIIKENYIRYEIFQRKPKQSFQTFSQDHTCLE